jgi:hypothetical protein
MDKTHLDSSENFLQRRLWKIEFYFLLYCLLLIINCLLIIFLWMWNVLRVNWVIECSLETRYQILPQICKKISAEKPCLFSNKALCYDANITVAKTLGIDWKCSSDLTLLFCCPFNHCLLIIFLGVWNVLIVKLMTS